MNKKQKVAFVLLLGFLAAFSVVGFLAFGHWAFESPNDPPPRGVLYTPNRIDAAWFTIQTLTTTGYGSLEFWPRRLKVLSSGLMVAGVLVWTILLGLAVNQIDRELQANPDDPA